MINPTDEIRRSATKPKTRAPSPVTWPAGKSKAFADRHNSPDSVPPGPTLRLFLLIEQLDMVPASTTSLLQNWLRLWPVLPLAAALVPPGYAAEEASPTPSPSRLLWPSPPLPAPNPEAGYATSASCQECHPDEHASWHRTYHRTMTQPATPETVLGRFDGTIIRSGGLTYRVFTEGGALYAEMPDPDQVMYIVQGGREGTIEQVPRVIRPVVMSTGSHHYQTYWVSSARHPGILQTLPLVFEPETRQWIPRGEAFMRAPGDRELMVTQWNHHCIRCHSTGGNPGLDDQGRLNTKVGELGIACEACHGPGEKHVQLEWARRRDQAATSAKYDHQIVNPKALDPVRSTQVCGQCHGNFVFRDEYALAFASRGALYRPGEDLHRTRYYIQYPGEQATPEQREELRKNPDFFASRWWEDGTVLAGGREYTALLATPCHTRGTLSCLSCHSMHDSEPNDQLKRGRDGPAACTQCHQEERFTIRLTEHTRHLPGSSGSDCLNCHMPHTTYALFKAIRSHQIQSPQIASSARHGVPNACNLCHLDQTLGWTQRHLNDWYQQTEMPLSDEQKEVPAAVLWLLKGHAAQRVIAAWHFGWEPAQRTAGQDWLAPFVAQLLTDDYGPVRFVAGRSLRSLPGFGEFKTEFLGAPRLLEMNRRDAVGRWQNLSGDSVTNHPFATASGGLDTNRIARLLSEQDRRPVNIKE